MASVISSYLSSFVRDQVAVGERVGAHDPPQGVLKMCGLFQIVEPPFEFFQVAIHMLRAHLVETRHDRPLEQAPHALAAVGMHVPDDPLLLGVVDPSRGGCRRPAMPGRTSARRCRRFGFVLHGWVDEGVQGVLPNVGNAAQVGRARRAESRPRPTSCPCGCRDQHDAAFRPPGFHPLQPRRRATARPSGRVPSPNGYGGTGTRPSCKLTPSVRLSWLADIPLRDSHMR